MKHLWMIALVAIGIIMPGLAWASGAAPHISNGMLQAAIAIGVCYTMAEAFHLMKMPSVVGMLMSGIVLVILFTYVEPLHEFGESFHHNKPLEIAAEIGACLLLFNAGLETNVKKMLSVGWSSAFVALIGGLVPTVLGWGITYLWIPDAGWIAHAFIGASSMATSVGITMAYLQGRGLSTTREGDVVKGGAVLDDMEGVIMLSVLAGAAVAISGGAASEGIDYSIILTVGGKAVLGIILSILVGLVAAPALGWIVKKMATDGVKTGVAFAFCMLFAYAADAAGLAPIIGAFCAGLVLDDVHFHVDESTTHEHDAHIEALMMPLMAVFVPAFFVHVGLMVPIEVILSQPGYVLLGLVLAFAGVIGKLVSGIGVVEKSVDRMFVGLAMIPRGEVGLIFLSFAYGGGHIDEGLFVAGMTMVLVTTIIGPILLDQYVTRIFMPKRAEAAAK